MNIEELKIIDFYKGVFATYADINNSDTQNISYNFDIFKIEPNNKTGIVKILKKVFTYNDSNIITRRINSSEFKDLLSQWLFHSEDFLNSNEQKIHILKDGLFKDLVNDLQITKFEIIDNSSFKRNDGINQFGQLVNLAILKNDSSSYLCLFMLDG